MQRFFEDLPWPVKILLMAAGSLMSAFSSKSPDGLQVTGLYLGILIAAIGVVATLWHAVKNSRRGKMILRLCLLIGGCAMGVVGLSIIAADDSPRAKPNTPDSTPTSKVITQPNLVLLPPPQSYDVYWFPRTDLRFRCVPEGQRIDDNTYFPIFSIQNLASDVVANEVSISWKPEFGGIEELIRSSSKFSKFHPEVSPYRILLHRGDDTRVMMEEPIAYLWGKEFIGSLQVVAKRQTTSMPYPLLQPAFLYFVETMPEDTGGKTKPLSYDVTISWNSPSGGTPKRYRVKVWATNLKLPETIDYTLHARLDFAVEQVN